MDLETLYAAARVYAACEGLGVLVTAVAPPILTKCRLRKNHESAGELEDDIKQLHRWEKNDRVPPLLPISYMLGRILPPRVYRYGIGKLERRLEAYNPLARGTD